MRKNIIIVGAGPAGLMAAWELSRNDVGVTILESDPQHVGGLAKTVNWHGYRYDIGGHRFFTKNSEIDRWWRERLGADFIRVKRQSRIIYNNRFFDYPLKPVNALSELGIGTTTKCVLSFLRRQIAPIKPERSLEDWVINRFGDNLYHIFFKTYTEKVWGIPCSDINADWASQRIQGLTLGQAIWKAFRGDKVTKTLIAEFDYPRFGAGMMWDKTRDGICARGGRIIMGTRVTRFECKNSRVIAALTELPNGTLDRHEADEFIVSMPLKDCVNAMDSPIVEPALAAAASLKYRAFILVFLIIQRENLFPDNWIYVHNSEVKVGRIQNFNNWGGFMVNKSGVTGLGLEYFCDEGDDVWKMTDEQLIELAKLEIQRLGITQPDEVMDGCVTREPKAYPVYGTHYQQNVRTIRNALAQFENLQVIGRNGMHKYNNQDHSMLTGKLAAQNILTGGAARYDLWRVNTDAEYLEGENRNQKGEEALK